MSYGMLHCSACKQHTDRVYHAPQGYLCPGCKEETPKGCAMPYHPEDCTCSLTPLEKANATANG